MENFINNTNDNTKQIKEIHTIGVHTCRYNTFEVIDEDTVVYPCGLFLQKFSISKNKVIKKIKFSNSLIMCFKRCFYFLVVGCYNGESYIIDIKSMNIVSNFSFENSDMMSHISVSSNLKYISLSCDFYRDTDKIIDGALAVYEKFINNENENIITYKQIYLNKLRESLCEFNSDDNLITVEKNVIPGETPKNKNYYYVIRLHDTNENFSILIENIIEHYDEINTIKKYNDFLALNYSRRVMKIIDLKSLDVVISLRLEGSGCMGDFEFFDDTLYLTNVSKKIIYVKLYDYLNKFENYSSYKEILIPKDVNLEYEIITGNQIGILIGQYEIVKQLNYSLRIYNNLIWISNENGLICFDLNEFTTKISLLSLIKSSGCGVSLNKDNNLIVVGDLDRNITVFHSLWEKYDLSKGEEEFHFHEDIINFRGQAYEAIRSVHWDEKLDYIFAGTMGGKIYRCGLHNKSFECLTDIHHTITCIRVHHVYGIDEPLLLASTTSGQMYIFFITTKGLKLINKFMAHLPQPDNIDLRFGSLKYKAEIWSLASHPQTKIKISNQNINALESSSKNTENQYLHIITSSEDQTIKIWELDIPLGSIGIKLLHSFKNHDLAVTSVDWKPMNILQGEVLVSCSDDQTIKIYDPINQFTHISTLSTKDIVLDWHTITYIALEENGTHLACSTQNGFIVIFDLQTNKPMFCEKVHMGGIEGLCWKGNLLVSCASDLNLTIIKI